MIHPTADVSSKAKIGKNVKIQNNVSIYDYAELKDGVMIGPHVCFTNDKYNRAINPDGSLKSSDDWIQGKIIIEEGASIGARSVLATDIKIGKFALIGMGSVVTKNIP